MKNTVISLLFISAIAQMGCKGRKNQAADKEPEPVDSAMVANGNNRFKTYCSNCHELFTTSIGPALAGVAANAGSEWVLQFLADPAKMINSGDKRSDSLFRKFKTIMPSFESLGKDNLASIVAYLKTVGQATRKLEKGIEDPIPEKIPLADIAVNLKSWIQFPATSTILPVARITKLASEPGSKNLFVNDLRGKLYKIKNNKALLYLDLAKLIPAFIDEPGLGTGFGSFAFHPDFANNGLLYTAHTEKPGLVKADFSYPDTIKPAVQWVLTEWKLTRRDADTVSGTKRELLRIDMITGAHGVQEIAFNPLAHKGEKDFGLLYIGIGDGACVQLNKPEFTHQKSKIWGTIIRIDPFGNNSSNGQYGIPPDNPYATDKAFSKETYAYGFRNPHRITWGRNGNIYTFNIGQGNIEAIDWVLPGHDYGWPYREGTFQCSPENQEAVFALPADDSTRHITYPIAQFDHDEGHAIAGGFEYSGNAIPRLKNKIIFGDLPSGRLFYINAEDIKLGRQAPIKELKLMIDGRPKTLKQLCGCNRVEIRFGRDDSGELYLLTKVDGRLYKIEPPK